MLMKLVIKIPLDFKFSFLLFKVGLFFVVCLKLTKGKYLQQRKLHMETVVVLPPCFTYLLCNLGVILTSMSGGEGGFFLPDKKTVIAYGEKCVNALLKVFRQLDVRKSSKCLLGGCCLAIMSVCS